jgi:thiol-disulfide isomerase/thioredoxin
MYIYSGPFAGASEQAERFAAWHGLGGPPPTAKQTYAGQARVRELTDRGFQNIFYDRNKVIVVSFWADSCRPCDAVASTVVSVAERFAKGRFANVMKFYHAQWDPKVNPRLHRHYGFGKIPVVYFYYTSSGRQPSKTAPLLEAAAGGDRLEADPTRYVRSIENILRHHGHIAPTATIAESRGWSTSLDMIDASDFPDVDRMLVAPSPLQKYFVDQYRADPQARLSRVGNVVPRSSFDVYYQRINGKAPGPDDFGTMDRVNRIIYLAAVRRLDVYLNSALHEAVHLFACSRKGFSTFYLNYGTGMAEGFTQWVTEEILRSQRVKMTKAPYAIERAMAAKLVEVVGLKNVADDYFLCTQNVHTRLESVRVFGQIVPLRKEAENATSDALRQQKYNDIIRLLESVRGRLQ